MESLRAPTCAGCGRLAAIDTVGAVNKAALTVGGIGGGLVGGGGIAMSERLLRGAGWSTGGCGRDRAEGLGSGRGPAGAVAVLERVGLATNLAVVAGGDFRVEVSGDDIEWTKAGGVG